MQFSILFGGAIAQGELGRGRHPGDGSDVLGAGAPLVFMRAPEHDWLDGQSAAQIKKTGAFRTVKFVSGETGRIDERDVSVDLAERLHHVAVEQNTALA